MRKIMTLIALLFLVGIFSSNAMDETVKVKYDKEKKSITASVYTDLEHSIVFTEVIKYLKKKKDEDPFYIFSSETEYGKKDYRAVEAMPGRVEELKEKIKEHELSMKK